MMDLEQTAETLLVTGQVPLAKQVIVTDSEGNSIGWEQGPSFAVGEMYALCRCRQSGNKPFCDGTHQKGGFDGTEPAVKVPYATQR
jgi:CDGSH-type Zn-finger protein